MKKDEGDEQYRNVKKEPELENLNATIQKKVICFI